MTSVEWGWTPGQTLAIWEAVTAEGHRLSVHNTGPSQWVPVVEFSDGEQLTGSPARTLPAAQRVAEVLAMEPAALPRRRQDARYPELTSQDLAMIRRRHLEGQ